MLVHGDSGHHAGKVRRTALDGLRVVGLPVEGGGRDPIVDLEGTTRDANEHADSTQGTVGAGGPLGHASTQRVPEAE